MKKNKQLNKKKHNTYTNLIFVLLTTLYRTTNETFHNEQARMKLKWNTTMSISAVDYPDWDIFIHSSSPLFTLSPGQRFVIENISKPEYLSVSDVATLCKK